MIKSSKGQGSHDDLFGDRPMVGLKMVESLSGPGPECDRVHERPGSDYDEVQ